MFAEWITFHRIGPNGLADSGKIDIITHSECIHLKVYSLIFSQSPKFTILQNLLDVIYNRF